MKELIDIRLEIEKYPEEYSSGEMGRKYLQVERWYDTLGPEKTRERVDRAYPHNRSEGR
jgi:hypothetical protein